MSEFQDKTLVCKDCGQEFTFTTGEQEFYAEKGFENEPQRCKNCRMAKKNESRGRRDMFEAKCCATLENGTPCQNMAKVPFRPTEGRPVYCSECYARMQEGGQA